MTIDGYAADHRAERPEVIARRERDALKAQLEQAIHAARHWHACYIRTRASLERIYRQTHPEPSIQGLEQ
ncbi:hypothetical protein SCMU_19320 [Sinomonas cyclohexanicum]|uniref:Uncharacterized protein n=1 Tax=Sinomonas cyclohexanicum TaxID=322009 RepID=A0ABN6FIE8_SINCY|nr:hypothetical protein [Corynebacterium cyclohexanicum]BCT76090.1 hypothetical protein SCMU_19320 [Corynebacterium cyclohexanicum]